MNSRGYDVLVRGSASVGPVWEDRAEGRPWSRAMKSCAVRWRSENQEHSISWRSATRSGPIASPGRSCATARRPRTARRMPSSGSTRRPARSPASRSSRPGSTGSWSTAASIASGAVAAGVGWAGGPSAGWSPAGPRRGGRGPRRRRRLVGWRDRGDDPDGPDPVEQAAAPFSDPADALDTEQRMSRVWALVNELSPQQRAAVTLSVREGLATRDIAAVLSVSEATVRVLLHRALSTLRRRLGDEA